jgi:hypothetical protein
MLKKFGTESVARSSKLRNEFKAIVSLPESPYNKPIEDSKVCS